MLAGELAERLHPEAGGKQLLFKLIACQNFGPQGLILDPTLISSFTSDVEDEDRVYPVEICQ